MHSIKLLSALLLLLGSVSSLKGQITGCDRDPSCTGNMLTIDETSGRNAEFVEVDNRNAIRNLSTAISFEAWIRPGEQPGKRAFVAGLWGPNQDGNDQWVIYIEGNTITFELNSPDAALRSTDNTIVSATVPDLYTRGWVHLTAVWGGGSTAARLFLDGVKVAEDSNTVYPLTTLHTPQLTSLQTQIGSTNALYDNQNRNRTFMGNMDEVRIWNRALSDAEIRCGYSKSLRGNENGLILYYRFNDNRNTSVLCDAAGNAHWGRMRNGIDLDTNDRLFPETYTVIPSAITTDISCTADTTFTFRFTDTSFCGSDVTLQMIGRDSALFVLSTTSLQLTQNSPRTVTARLQASITGDIEATLRVKSVDRCGTSIDIPITINRTTELLYSQTRVELDTLYVDCLEAPWTEDTIEICNNTGRSIQIRGAAIGDPTNFSVRPADPARPLPITLAAGDCWEVIVRANASDSTRTFYDTLRIDSDDRCPGSGVVPLMSHTQDVIVLMNNRGDRIDRGGPPINFGNVCPNQLSDVRLYQYRNLATDSATIDSMWFGTNEYFARRRAFPLLLPPNFAFQPDFMRFRPFSAGTKQDTFYVRGSYRGCTIEKKFAVSGYGINVDNGFNDPNLSFGNVTVGKTSRQSTTAFNNGDDARFTVYLKKGDVFRITSGRGFQLNNGDTRNVTVEFRPREARVYYDTLCLFDQRCFTTTCIPVSGTGLFDALEFDPAFSLIENVVGCECGYDTIRAKNVSGGPLDYTVTFPTSPEFTVTANAPTSGQLAAGAEIEYYVEYCPNDLTNDRSDNDFITINLAGGESYEILLRANSVVPRLFVEPLTAFGTVEAGWQKREMILVENISAVPVRVTNVSVPPGYVLVGTNPGLQAVLNPRDSLWVEVEFQPTQEIDYNDSIRVETDAPCDVDFAGALQGRGKVVRLDVPVTFINFGLNKPCECTERTIPLPNESDFIPLTIDSLWIDGVGVTNPNPLYFSWYSKQTGGTAVPYTIPPKSSDTLVIRFCPSGPSDTSQVVHNARIHIAATGTDSRGVEIWSEEFATTISGRREIFFISNRSNNRVGFGRPRTVGTTTNTNVWIRVPDQFLNPSGDSIVITDVTFAPEDRVFAASANTGDPLPWVIRRGEAFRINLSFTPRAPKTYIAKMELHMSEPCPDIDTTIELIGSGYASKFGWPTAFDTARSTQDTFRLSTCDTLMLPIMAKRGMPQELIDILFRIDYDTNSLVPLDVISPWTSNTSVIDTGTGAHVRLTDAANVGPGEFAWVRFLVRGSPNAFRITLDNFDFDSDSLVEYDYVPLNDVGWVIVDEPMLAIDSFTDFDTVLVKQCADQTVMVRNPGVLPVQFDSLALPPDHAVTGSSIPFPVTLMPGDSIELTVTFCPRAEWVNDTASLGAFGSAPCLITDSAGLRSIGYAPPWPIRLTILEDPVQGMIGDTVTVTIESDSYLPVAPVDLQFPLSYNRRALQFIDISTPYQGASISAAENPTGLSIALPGVDSLDAGPLARLRFIVSVPDSVTTKMYLDSAGIAFSSDSIFFVKPVPGGDETTVQVDPRCNITYLNFRPGTTNRLSTPTPNPATNRVEIEVEFFEDAAAELILFDAAGREVIRVIDGSEVMSGGTYLLEIDVRNLPNGEYFYRLRANRFSATERLRIVR